MTDATVDPATTDRPTVLFICTHNAGRSQLGAHLLSLVAGDRFTAISGGIAPADAPSPTTVATLAELGVDASHAFPRAVTPEDLQTADVVVTMKPGLTLPGPVAGELVEWTFPDPANWNEDGVRELRDHIREAVTGLAERLRPTATA
ncbi:low molecular weight phosphatase family protein [Microbacterium paludicola]|uniref:arsenate-mycothiol transferase ArsC n=1 Tax=Microbacterium paludicola TaxID=300019 RepID=UPI0031D9595E